MTRTLFLASILIGCGATPAPPPKQAPPPPPPVAVVKPPPPQPCEVAAQVLVKEHHIDKIPEAKREQARRAGEAEVVAACLDDQWPTAAIDCMSARAAPSSCFGQLEAMQERRINRDLDGWERKWSKPAEGAGYGGDTYGGDSDISHMPKMTPPPREEWISCEPSIGDPANYDPVIKPDAVDHDYAVKVRRDLLHDTCNMRWSNTDKKCFGAAQTPAAVATCRANLDEASRNAIANSIADAAGKLVRVAALKKNANAISCKAVSLVRYSDDAWAGKLATLPAAERTRLITESRAKMVATCTADKWTAMERACIVVGGGRREMEMTDCFRDSHGGMMMFRWGFPPSGVIYKSGIADCDALGEIIKKLAACDKIDKDQRTSISDMFSMQLAMWSDVAPDRRAEVAKQCKESQRMYSDHGREKGCAM